MNDDQIARLGEVVGKTYLDNPAHSLPENLPDEQREFYRRTNAEARGRNLLLSLRWAGFDVRVRP
jgi:hypothetical protein